MSNRVEPYTIYSCSACDTFVYGQDAVIYKKKLYCKTCYLLGMSNLYDTRKARMKANFLTMFLPFIFALLFLASSFLGVAFPDESWPAYIMLAFLLAFVINVCVSAYLFTAKFDIMSEIGNPEGVMIEVSGSINADSGRVSATGHVYDTYTAGQTISMFGNIIKFLIIVVVVAALGWLFFIGLAIRLAVTKKKLQKAKLLFGDALDDKYKITCALCCHGPFDEDQGFEYVIGTSEIDEYPNLIYRMTMIYENQIVALCSTQEEELIIFKILPGYKHQIVEDADTFEAIRAKAIAD